MARVKCENCGGTGLVSQKELCAACKGTGRVNVSDAGEQVSEQQVSGLAIGRIVHYRSRTGKYTVPAVITATVDTLYRPGVDGGFLADLTNVNNVHLTVLTPGYPGKRKEAWDKFEARAEAPVSENVAGTYQEWDVPHGELDAEGNLPAGTWGFPQY
jgi:hypothetical protein